MVKTTFKIALDGPSGSGKSTLAKNLAKRYGFVYIDTGALYRTIGLFVCERGIASDDKAGIISCLPDIKIEMKLENGGGAVYLGGKRIGDEIRTPVISKYASDVSKIPEVRAFLLETQRSIARENNVIMDGRDIGTVILPDAQIKLFVTASPEARAKRRYNELCERGVETSYEEVLADMKWRDANDSGREIAPAIPAPDAILFDNSGMTIEETVENAAEIIDKVYNK
ncbi:MAG: (d)CMP kinase [Clostridia bacterium]|jgi:cytidylate kinase|nr:(d)CMP kinase [Clostridia bacterium]MBO5786661.1 (d)CMP kinase [Clostridia bacterium]MBO5914333.1 (d)CMP kinase [Clostridia bacterium]